MVTVLSGAKTFQSDVDITGTEGLTMDSGIKINGIDPSLALVLGAQLKYPVIKIKQNFGDGLEVRICIC